MEMTLEQKQTLESFSVQRDALLLDLSNLQKEKDTLQSVNKRISESTQAILSESDEKTLEILRMEGEIARLEDMICRADLSASKTMSSLEEKKIFLEKELDFKLKILRNITESVDKLVSKAGAIETTISKSSVEVAKVISQVNSHLTSANEMVASLQSSTEKFNSFVIEKEQDIVKRTGELDKKFALLQAREKSIDDRYNSLVAEINKTKKNTKA